MTITVIDVPRVHDGFQISGQSFDGSGATIIDIMMVIVVIVNVVIVIIIIVVVVKVDTTVADTGSTRWWWWWCRCHGVDGWMPIVYVYIIYIDNRYSLYNIIIVERSSYV